jgi:hypothetical protein
VFVASSRSHSLVREVPHGMSGETIALPYNVPTLRRCCDTNALAMSWPDHYGVPIAAIARQMAEQLPCSSRPAEMLRLRFMQKGSRRCLAEVACSRSPIAKNEQSLDALDSAT